MDVHCQPIKHIFMYEYKYLNIHQSMNSWDENECNESGWDEDWWMNPTKPNKTTWILMREYKWIFHGWTKRLMDLCHIVKWNED
jgi:hypothetical protein